MGGHKTISCSSDELPIIIPPPPVPDYEVYGAMIPDCQGFYFYGGEHNGYPYYVREDSVWYIFAALFGFSWYINTILGRIAPPMFAKTSPGIVGSYIAVPPYTGAATVVEYVP